MKKIVYLLLAMAIALNCFASCNATSDQNTTGSEHTGSVVSESNEFVSPDDEARAVHTVSAENKDGLKMEITVHGYRSESLNREFYVKSNEYFTVDVKVTNTSEKPLWQWLPTYCRNGGGIPHNHEIGFDISCGEYGLSSSSIGFMCPTGIDIWKLEPGETYEWQLKLAAGEEKWDGSYDLPADEDGRYAGIALYDQAIYSEGVCTFAGEFFFGYRTSKIGDRNDFSLSVPLTVDVVYISAKPNGG
jgi:hypothetical protein